MPSRPMLSQVRRRPEGSPGARYRPGRREECGPTHNSPGSFRADSLHQAMTPIPPRLLGSSRKHGLSTPLTAGPAGAQFHLTSSSVIHDIAVTVVSLLLRKPLVDAPSWLDSFRAGHPCLAALLLGRILPVSSLVAPGQPGAALRNTVHPRRRHYTSCRGTDPSITCRNWSAFDRGLKRAGARDRVCLPGR